MAELIQRSKLAHFMDTTPKGAQRTYSRIGDGVTDLSVSMNPETETQQYIHQDSATTLLKNYGLTIDTTQTAMKDDPVFEFVDDLSFKQAVAGDAKTTLVEARLYKGTTGPYPAKRWNVNISVTSYGGAASDTLGHEYTINVEGDPVFGTFDLDALTFTPTP